MAANASSSLNLPRDPDEQLRLGLRIVEAAYEEKARHLDHELQQLRAYSKERQQQVSLLERRVAELEGQVRDGDDRVRVLSDEKAALHQELKNTQRDLSKLDSFKRSIMQSIKDEELPGMSSGGGAATYAAAAEYTPAAPLGGRESLMTTLGGGASSPAPGAVLGSFSTSPKPTPSEAAASATNVPQESATARLDGKDFFRQARLRLTYEQFNQFLANIKRLNDRAQSRDDTIRKAQEIFGPENDDLFTSFKTLLSKHGLS